VYKVPGSMPSENAAPVLCGGWTVWNALTGYDLKPTDHVGVVGIGGLGHFAIQLANMMGCEVTAFSGTESKKADAFTLGLLVCSNSHIPWELFHPILAGRATVFPLQIPEDMAAPLSVPHMPFLRSSINVIYSTNGRHDAYDKLLAFAALHDVKPIIEKFPMTREGIEESLKRLEEGKMRYRGVLVV
jgi:D-arabinose 1-dehydrogenase-like Zn-dependent alcohol dehydrogenase